MLEPILLLLTLVLMWSPLTVLSFDISSFYFPSCSPAVRFRSTTTTTTGTPGTNTISSFNTALSFQTISHIQTDASDNIHDLQYNHQPAVHLGGASALSLFFYQRSGFQSSSSTTCSSIFNKLKSKRQWMIVGPLSMMTISNCEFGITERTRMMRTRRRSRSVSPSSSTTALSLGSSNNGFDSSWRNVWSTWSSFLSPKVTTLTTVTPTITTTGGRTQPLLMNANPSNGTIGSNTKTTTTISTNGLDEEFIVGEGGDGFMFYANGDTTSSKSKGNVADDNDMVPSGVETSAGTTIFQFAPRPPMAPPPVMSYQELLEETDRAMIVVDELERRVEELQQSLVSKETRLAQSEMAWTDEKQALLGTIDEISTELQQMVLFQQQKEQEQAGIDDEDEGAYEREQLERELRLLQGQLPQVQNQLREEKERAQELKERLDFVEDTIEYQQMEFEKEKKEIQSTLELEKDKLVAMQREWDMEKVRFGTEKRDIEMELKKEIDRLETAQKKLVSNQEAFEFERNNLLDKLDGQRRKLVETEQLLTKERGNYTEERIQLQSELEREKSKLIKAEKYFKEAETLFNKVEEDLQQKVEDEQNKVSVLNDRLQREEERFNMERTDLELRILSEQNRIVEVENRLRQERFEANKDKIRLENELTEQVRLNREKKYAMNRRYRRIREEMTELWEATKRDAREQRRALRSKYEGQMSAMTEAMGTLQADLESAVQKGNELQVLLADMTDQKNRAVKEKVDLEQRYINMVAQRNQEISGLRQDLKSVRDLLKEKEAEINRYRTSYREMLKLSWQLTGTRLKNTGKRITGVFRRQKSNAALSGGGSSIQEKI